MLRTAAIILILIGLGLGVGYGVFQVVIGGTPKVGVINGPGNVIDDELASALKAQLFFAAQARDVKAVVLFVNSPGGSASASEDIFLAVAELRRKKPVVTKVQGVAASGAYLAALGSNHIVASGTAVVGSIGAILLLPPSDSPSERVLPTGPSKETGGSERTYQALLELVKEVFFLAVTTQRGDRLRADREEILQGKIYLGVEALQLGLIDELGSDKVAIEKAAQLAGLQRYAVADVGRLMARAGGAYAQAAVALDQKKATGDFAFDGSNSQFPYIHYLYLPP